MTKAAKVKKPGSVEVVTASEMQVRASGIQPSPFRDDSPMQMLQTAIAQKMDPGTIEKLMDLRDRWEASEARKAFMQAMAAFKANPPKIIHDKVNKQYGSTYTSLANLVNTTNASLSEHGLNARWDYKQDQQITVTCILTHFLGHSVEVTLSGPPDASGAKNDLQKIKSTITYLKLATFEGATGIASEAGSQDDDGNGAGLPRLTKEQADALRAKITELGADAAERAEILNQFLTYRKVDNLEDIAGQAFDDCMRALNTRKKKAHG